MRLDLNCKGKEIRTVQDLKEAMTAEEAFLFINTMDEHTVVIMEFSKELIDMQAGGGKGSDDGND